MTNKTSIKNNLHGNKLGKNKNEIVRKKLYYIHVILIMFPT